MERYMLILKSYKRMPLEIEEILRNNVFQISVSKHQIIQTPDVLNDNLYFIEKGLVHLFILVNGRKESLGFRKEDQFIVTLKSACGDPGDDGSGIEALEDLVLWCFPGRFVEDLKKKFHQFSIQYLAILSKEMLAFRHASICSDPTGGDSNYEHLLRHFPELVDRVPVNYLASFLQIPEKVILHLKSSKMKLLVSTTRRYRRGKKPNT